MTLVVAMTPLMFSAAALPAPASSSDENTANQANVILLTGNLLESDRLSQRTWTDGFPTPRRRQNEDEEQRKDRRHQRAGGVQFLHSETRKTRSIYLTAEMAD